MESLPCHPYLFFIWPALSGSLGHGPKWDHKRLSGTLSNHVTLAFHCIYNIMMFIHNNNFHHCREEDWDIVFFLKSVPKERVASQCWSTTLSLVQRSLWFYPNWHHIRTLHPKLIMACHQCLIMQVNIQNLTLSLNVIFFLQVSILSQAIVWPFVWIDWAMWVVIFQ